VVNKTPRVREVVQLVTRDLYEGDAQLIALCKDGSMWVFRGMLGGASYPGKWTQITPVPDGVWGESA
jgi:hypothetical protein